MFSSYYNLKFNPFSETPDIDLFYQSQVHKFALYQLIESMDSGHGFTMLTGEVGVGKTLLSRLLLDLTKEDLSSALVLHPNLEQTDLLKLILQEFNVLSTSNSYKDILDLFTEYLIENFSSGKRALLVIDEAQNLSLESLETIRLLSNIELNNQKLLQIILVGQTELEQKLRQYSLRQINQRISSRIRLEKMSLIDTEFYIRERIDSCGGANFIRFSESAIGLIHQLSKGTPRLINMICEYSVMSGEFNKARLIKKQHVMEALVQNNLVEKQPLFKILSGRFKLVQT